MSKNRHDNKRRHGNSLKTCLGTHLLPRLAQKCMNTGQGVRQENLKYPGEGQKQLTASVSEQSADFRDPHALRSGSWPALDRHCYCEQSMTKPVMSLRLNSTYLGMFQLKFAELDQMLAESGDSSAFELGQFQLSDFRQCFELFARRLLMLLGLQRPLLV